MIELTKKNNTGEVLRLLRVAYDLSISDLADKINVSKSYIAEIEKGIKNPSEKIIQNYSIGLNIPESTLQYLFDSYSQKHLPYQELLMKILRKISKL